MRTHTLYEALVLLSFISKTLKRVNIKGLLWLKLIECTRNRHLLCDTLNFKSKRIQKLNPSLLRNKSRYIIYLLSRCARKEWRAVYSSIMLAFLLALVLALRVKTRLNEFETHRLQHEQDKSVKER